MNESSYFLLDYREFNRKVREKCYSVHTFALVPCDYFFKDFFQTFVVIVNFISKYRS